MPGKSWAYLFLALIAATCGAESKDSNPAVNVYIVRGAEQLNGPHTVTYRLAEWTQIRGRWMVPDIGYYDTGYGKDQIWFAGGGFYLVNKPRVAYYQEFYVTQEAGPEAHNQRGLWIWPVVETRFKKSFFNQVAAIPTIPLNASQRWGFDIDRAKSEWAPSPHWLVGAGYSGGICSTRTWESKPFVTATRKTRSGNYEVWIQRTAGGAQVQLRYLFVQGDH